MMHSNLRDDITQRWDYEVIASVVQPFVDEHKIDTVRPASTQILLGSRVRRF